MSNRVKMNVPTMGNTVRGYKMHPGQLLYTIFVALGQRRKHILMRKITGILLQVFISGSCYMASKLSKGPVSDWRPFCFR